MSNGWTPAMEREYWRDVTERVRSAVTVPPRMVVTYSEAVPLGNDPHRCALCSAHDNSEDRARLRHRCPNVERGARMGVCAICVADAAAPVVARLRTLADSAAIEAELVALEAHAGDKL